MDKIHTLEYLRCFGYLEFNHSMLAPSLYINKTEIPIIIVQSQDCNESINIIIIITLLFTVIILAYFSPITFQEPLCATQVFCQMDVYQERLAVSVVVIISSYIMYECASYGGIQTNEIKYLNHQNTVLCTHKYQTLWLCCSPINILFWV